MCSEYLVYKMHFVIQADPNIHEIKQITWPGLVIGASEEIPVAFSDGFGFFPHVFIYLITWFLNSTLIINHESVDLQP